MKKKLILRALTLFLLLFVTFPFAAQAEERVLSFDVTAAMQNDGAMVVTERIRVIIEHKLIRQGITHAFPVKELYDGKKLRHYGFELLSVTLDEKKVNYYQNDLGYASGIAIGKEGVGAPLGEHTYEIRYKTTGHVRPMQDRDEIYYNVMSSNWEFPVDHVSFTLQLPGGDENTFIETVAYTGGHGESGSDYIVEGKHTIRTTRALKPGEGLTVAMAWKKGLVTLPDESLANIMGANRTSALIGIFSIILLFFGASRYIIRLGPKSVAVVPLFSPPDGMSPGYMASLKSMAYQGRMLHADLVWAAVNGLFRLDARDKKNILLRKSEYREEPKRMKSGGEWARKQCEELAGEFFFGLRGEVNLRDKDGKELAADAFEHLEKKYSKQQKGFWKHNYIPVVPGLILLVGLLCWVMKYIYSPMLDIGADYGGPFGYLAIMSMVFFLIGLSIYGLRKAVRVYDGLRRLALLILLPLMLVGVLATLWFLSSGDWFFMFMLAAIMGMATWFVANPPGILSKKGRERYAKVQGLEMYIRTAEKNRLAKLNAPEDTIEKFEELLPYAVALGCADAWQKRFDTVLADMNYAPDWAETNGGHIPYRTALGSLLGAGGMGAAAQACAKLSQDSRISSSSGSGSGMSGGGSGFGGGSVGGGSGGSRVGGW